jgi:hypothetical protein
MGRITGSKNNRATVQLLPRAALRALGSHSGAGGRWLALAGALMFLRGAAAIPMAPAEKVARFNQLADLGCCVAYGVTYEHAECCHDFRDSQAEDCETQHEWVGGGHRFHRSSCAATKQLDRYVSATTPITAAAAPPCQPPALCITTPPHHPSTAQTITLPDSSRANTETTSVIGHAGPTWTYDSRAEAPSGERDMGDYTVAVFTEEQQGRLGVTEFGRPLPKDPRWITPILGPYEGAKSRSTDQRSDEPQQVVVGKDMLSSSTEQAATSTATLLPGVLPVEIPAGTVPSRTDEHGWEAVWSELQERAHNLDVNSFLQAYAGGHERSSNAR